MNDTHSGTDDDGRVPRSISGKLTMLRTLAGELARVDWAALPTTVQDEAVRVLEEAEAAQAAIRGAALAAISDGPVLSWYGQQTLTSFLVAETRITRPAARAHHAWARRHSSHPQVMDALARMQIKTSIAVKICGWTGQLPQQYQAMADEILLTAWLGGCTEGDLAMLARQMRHELDPGHDDKPPAPGLTVDTTIDGAAVLHGDLTPGVTALVKAAFDTYAAKQGPEDHRTLAERQHDALGHICRQVLTLAGQPHPSPATTPPSTGSTSSPDPASSQATTSHTPAAGNTHDSETPGSNLTDSATPDGHPEDEEDEQDDGLFATPAQPAGSTADGNGTNGTGRPLRPVTALVHINVADLISLPQGHAFAKDWIRNGAVTWAGENARNAAEPGYGGAWLTGSEARAYTTGASVTPVVTGCPDTSVIPRLAAAGARLHQFLLDEQAGRAVDPQRKPALAADLLGHAIKALSGPAGYASYLRTRLFGGTVLGSGSLVLDVGRQRHIPRQLRITIAIRDRKCSWPGCDRAAIKTQPHHVEHYAHGGRTNPENIKTYCWAHHHLVLHQQGWNGTMHPDGTVDLYRPDGTRYTPGTRYQPHQRE
ncbi:MAG TPA: DUF222 domain-containing protein [Streptosporangiaceae bacterium]|nr:DUF222 domain-containing protein [Streptosporangiaceae bacterium]